MNIKDIRLVSCINTSSYGVLTRFLLQKEFVILELDGRSIHDDQTFFLEVIRKLPLDPPLSGKVNWDALSDSFWGGVDELGNVKVAVLWVGVTQMLEQNLAEFLIAIDCFRQVASNLISSQSGVTTPITMLIFLLGDGPSFKMFSE